MQIIDMTAIFLSLIVYKPDRNNLVLHVIHCVCLLISFVVLFTMTGIDAIKQLTAPTTTRVSSSPTAIATPKSSKQTSSNNNALAITPMRSTADLATAIDNKNKQAEPIAVDNRSNNMSTSTSTNSITTTNSTSITSSTSSVVTPPQVVTTPPSSPSKMRSAQLSNNDAIIKKQDLSTQESAQVIPMKVSEHVVGVAAAKQQVTQPTILVKNPEPPQQNNENQPLPASIEITASEQTPEPEQYYENIEEKGDDLMAFSDNSQRIYDDPPTPSIDPHIKPFSIMHPSAVLYDEGITTTPALTPPNQSSAAGSTISRKSSTTSQHSTFRTKLQTAMQKVRPSSNGNSKQQQDVVIPAASSSTTVASSSSTKAAKKSRFASIRLTRKRDLKSVMDMTQSETGTPAQAPSIKPARSISTKFNTASKRLSKIFSQS
ncbi:hypothetical protein [Parasitella parasitica]|uniref:Uncharacterized protein n=1 Tax=Parasitella parasitica TaxID=35722 RepID=A0A0B7N6P3_9FUNG|nr:hypothetical protein [Parasitella parasitica]